MLSALQMDPTKVSSTQTASGSQAPTIQQPHVQEVVSVPTFLREWKGFAGNFWKQACLLGELL